MKNISKLILTFVFGTMAFGFQAKAEDFPADIKPLMTKYACSACHSVDKIVALIAKPQPSNWPGYPPMAPMANVPKEDAVKLAKFINSLR